MFPTRVTGSRTVGGMGFLDRFSRARDAPDALTAEVVARLRVLPTVEAAQATAADSVTVTWAAQSRPTTIDLTDLRPRWREASGFDRIELLDLFIEGLPTGGGAPVAPGEGPVVAPRSDPVAEASAVPPADVGWSSAGADLLPVLRREVVAGTGAISWPVAGILHAVIVGADRWAPVTTTDCERWSVDAEEVRTRAVTNLRTLDPAPDPIGPGVRAWVATAPQGLQSSWIVDPGAFLRAVGLDSGIAFAPLPGELVVVDAADAALVQSVTASTLRIVAEQQSPLTPVPFVLTDDGAQVWEPPAGHPAAADVAQARGHHGGG